MSIIIPDDLPASAVLRREGIEVSATAGDGPAPLRIAILNLMPTKAQTETQFARLLGGTQWPVELTLFVPDHYIPRHTPCDHVDRFYARWSEVRERPFDGLIVTGAPVETMPFEQVSYWQELAEVFRWALERVACSLYICWAGQAALYTFYGVPKRSLPAKISGVFRQEVLAPETPLLRGMGETFDTPVSRHTEVIAGDLPAGVDLLARSPESGICLAADAGGRATYMFNHLEYDAGTLHDEYERDHTSGRGAQELPKHYYPANDPARLPPHGWRGAAQAFFRNWLGMVAAARSVVDDQDAIDWILHAPAAMREGLPRSQLLFFQPDAAGEQRSGSGTRVMLELPGADADAAERLARSIVKDHQAIKAAYRSSGGSGGVIVDDAVCSPITLHRHGRP